MCVCMCVCVCVCVCSQSEKKKVPRGLEESQIPGSAGPVRSVPSYLNIRNMIKISVPFPILSVPKQTIPGHAQYVIRLLLCNPSCVGSS